MYLENKFIQFLIKNRISIILIVWTFLFIGSFNIGLILWVFAEHYDFSDLMDIGFNAVFIIVPSLLLIFYVATGVLKHKIKKNSIDIGKDETETIGLYDDAASFGYRKYRLFGGCLGTYIIAFIAVFSVAIAFGFDDHFAEYITGYFFGGLTVWCPFAWKILDKKLK